MQYSFLGESHTSALLFVIFDGPEGFIVQGGEKDRVPLPGQKLKAFIPVEMSKISVGRGHTSPGKCIILRGKHCITVKSSGTLVV